MKFTYVLNDVHDPRYNLALEETLFREAAECGEGFLMFWSNDPTVVVGHFQNVAAEVNREFVEARGIFVVRRITGGGAVYHDRGNLNYSIILPTQSDALLDIQAFGIPLVDYLGSLGVAAERSGRNDVTIDGRKFSGVAQYSADGVVLHHGTMLFDSHLEDVAGALNVKAEKFQSKGFKSVRSRVTNLLPFLPVKMTLEQFRDGFAKALIEFYLAAEVRPPSADEQAGARKLAAEKYSTREWTWGTSPQFTVSDEKRFPGGTIQIGLVVEGGVVKDCRIHGDYFALNGPEEVESRLRGQPYPFEKSEAILDDELLKKSFLGIESAELRKFIMG